MENFVHEYYSVENFQKAYKGRVRTLPHEEEWPEVDIAKHVGTPLGTRDIGHPKKNRFKGFLEGGSGKKRQQNENEEGKQMIRGKVRCSNCGELGHRKTSSKCPNNGTKKKASLQLKFLHSILYH